MMGNPAIGPCSFQARQLPKPICEAPTPASEQWRLYRNTVPANAEISRITDRMPLILSEEDIELWLGELRAPIEDVKALIRTREFDPAEWNIGPEDPDKKPPRPRKKRRSEIDRPDLFPKR